MVNRMAKSWFRHSWHYYYSSCNIFSLCHDSKLIFHLIENSNDHESYIKEIIFAICRDHTYEDLVNVVDMLQIDITKYEATCWLGYIIGFSHKYEKDKEDIKSLNFITFFVQHNFSPETIIYESPNKNKYTVKYFCNHLTHDNSKSHKFYKHVIKIHYPDYKTNETRCIIA